MLNLSRDLAFRERLQERVRALMGLTARTSRLEHEQGAHMAHGVQLVRVVARDEALVRPRERAQAGVLALFEPKQWRKSAPSLLPERVWCDSVRDRVPDGEG